MAPTYTLERTQILPLPPEQVFAFFSEAGNLEAITPPFLRFQIITPGPIQMQAGALIDYHIRLKSIFDYRQQRVLQLLQRPQPASQS